MEKVKVCKRCGVKKLTSEFSANRNRTDKYIRIRPRCKPCRAEEVRLERLENPEKFREQDNERHKTPERKKWRKQYASEKKEFILAWQRQWRRENKDRINREKREDYKINKKEINARNKHYYDNNRDKMREAGKRYYEANRYAFYERALQRHYDKQQAIPGWVDRDKMAVVYDKAHELGEVTGLKYHVDHVYPLKSKYVCGFHVWENLQVMEAKLNHSKSNKATTYMEVEHRKQSPS